MQESRSGRGRWQWWQKEGAGFEPPTDKSPNLLDWIWRELKEGRSRGRAGTTELLSRGDPRTLGSLLATDIGQKDPSPPLTLSYA